MSEVYVLRITGTIDGRLLAQGPFHERIAVTEQLVRAWGAEDGSMTFAAPNGDDVRYVPIGVRSRGVGVYERRPVE